MDKIRIYAACPYDDFCEDAFAMLSLSPITGHGDCYYMDVSKTDKFSASCADKWKLWES